MTLTHLFLQLGLDPVITDVAWECPDTMQNRICLSKKALNINFIRLSSRRAFRWSSSAELRLWRQSVTQVRPPSLAEPTDRNTT